MTDTREHQLRTAAARADFLEFGPAGAAGVDDVVAASWERSQSAGVDADRYHVAYFEDVDFDSRLARCAEPVIERLTQDMCDVPVTIALTDAKARIVDRRDCSTAVARILDRVDFQPGFCFVEDGVGTNGVGTVFEVGAPVSVVGCEHFNQSLIQFACTGAPIFDPTTGRVAGVLDASMLADTWNPLVDAMIRTAAGEIGRNLLVDRSRAKRALFETYLHADARPRQAVIAVEADTRNGRGLDTVMANERARELLSATERDDVAQFAQFLMTKQEHSARWLALDNGRRIRLRSSVITCDGNTVGMVILLDDDGPTPSGMGISAIPGRPSTTDPLRRLPGRPTVSSAWRASRDEAVATIERGERLLILGEPGSGRLSLVTEAFGAVHGGAPVVVVDADRLSRGEQITRPRADIDGPALLIIRHVDVATPDMANILCDMADTAASAGYLLAMTAGPAPDGTAETLLRRLDQTVTVPPLRVRGAELDTIVSRIVRDLAPGRVVRLSPTAIRLLHAYAWPGNIRQLREALAEALRRRPVGEIQPADLPGFCRSSTSRTLTKLEASERDTIIAALTECDGNRMRAAETLGLSRSSLYRKMSTYRITGV